jgi:hypothetical protein
MSLSKTHPDPGPPIPSDPTNAIEAQNIPAVTHVRQMPRHRHNPTLVAPQQIQSTPPVIALLAE